jgi:hypothetical protein
MVGQRLEDTAERLKYSGRARWRRRRVVVEHQGESTRCKTRVYRRFLRPSMSRSVKGTGAGPNESGRGGLMFHFEVKRRAHHTNWEPDQIRLRTGAMAGIGHMKGPQKLCCTTRSTWSSVAMSCEW